MIRHLMTETPTLRAWLDARDLREKGLTMNFWEHWILGMFLQLLHATRFDPSRLPILKTVLLDIYDTIGSLLGLPARGIGL
jgi:hypothetical protein